MIPKEGWIAKLRGCLIKDGYEARDYLSIQLEDGKRLQGGNQNWYFASARKSDSEEKGLRQTLKRCRADENYRLANLGCGVIAMTNLELYLGRTRYGEITKKQYEKAVSEGWKQKYRIGGTYLNLITGLYPWKMEKGLSEFLKDHGLARQRVKWAPYALKSQKKQREMVLKAMEGMLSDDYPVVFSYHTFEPKKKGLTLYSTLEDAERGASPSSKDQVIDSHYMTATGIYRTKNDLYILQTESWGRIYYVRYDKYSEKLNYFTNLLMIW